MAKHTKAPWKVGHGLNNDGSRPVSSEEGRIAFVHVRDEDAPSKNLWKFEDAERDANARLIAAAPEMLEALKTVVNWVAQGSLSEHDGPYTKAHAAIVMATSYEDFISKED